MSRFRLSTVRYNAPYTSRYASYIKDRIHDGKDTAAVNSHDKDLPTTHGSYGALVLHPKWKSKRKEILRRDNHKCVVCDSEVDLQVHHRQYHFITALKMFKVPWDYPENLLITLCSICHSRGHSRFKVPTIKI